MSRASLPLSSAPRTEPRPFVRDWVTAPNVVLVAGLVVFGALGLAGVGIWRDWPLPARWALAAMFLVTAGARLSPLRAELVAMVPPRIPFPGLLVNVTGALEAIGAVGLIIPPVAPAAAVCLALLLLAVFPANVHAARVGDGPGRSQATPLVPRAIHQAVYVAVAIACI